MLNWRSLSWWWWCYDSAAFLSPLAIRTGRTWRFADYAIGETTSTSNVKSRFGTALSNRSFSPQSGRTFPRTDQSAKLTLVWSASIGFSAKLACRPYNHARAWFPPLRFRSSVTVSPCSVSKIRENYVHPQEFRSLRKKSVLCCRKFAVSDHPFKYRIEFWFFRIRLVPVHGAETTTALRNGSADTIM